MFTSSKLGIDFPGNEPWYMHNIKKILYKNNDREKVN